MIGDSADAPRYVETVGRKGYRFIAPVERTTAPEIGPQVSDGIEGRPSSRAQTVGPAPPEPVQQLKPSPFWPYLIVLGIGLAAGEGDKSNARERPQQSERLLYPASTRPRFGDSGTEQKWHLKNVVAYKNGFVELSYRLRKHHVEGRRDHRGIGSRRLGGAGDGGA